MVIRFLMVAFINKISMYVRSRTEHRRGIRGGGIPKRPHPNPSPKKERGEYMSSSFYSSSVRSVSPFSNLSKKAKRKIVLIILPDICEFHVRIPCNCFEHF